MAKKTSVPANVQAESPVKGSGQAFLKALLATEVPILIWGPPGVGKTAAVQSLGRTLGMHVETVIASIHEPTDFSGLPYVENGTARYAPPAWAVRLKEAGRGILFLDEISTAPPAVQAALLRVALERAVGELTLPQGVRVIAAGNPPEIAAGGWDLSAPLANRFLHVQWELNTGEWCDEFITYWGNPPRLDHIDPNLWAQARVRVAGFIRFRGPKALLDVPKEESLRGRAWPSPRTWDFASRVLAAYKLDADAAQMGIAAAVGSGAAGEFCAWLRTQDLPDPEELLADPTKYRHPDRGDTAYVIMNSVVSAVASTTAPNPQQQKALKTERWLNAWRVLGRAAQFERDIATVAAMGLAQMMARGEIQTDALRRKDAEDVTKIVTEFAPIVKEAGMLP